MRTRPCRMGKIYMDKWPLKHTSTTEHSHAAHRGIPVRQRRIPPRAHTLKVVHGLVLHWFVTSHSTARAFLFIFEISNFPMGRTHMLFIQSLHRSINETSTLSYYLSLKLIRSVDFLKRLPALKRFLNLDDFRSIARCVCAACDSQFITLNPRR